MLTPKYSNPTPPLCPFWHVPQQREISFIPPYTPATQMLGEIFSNLGSQKQHLALKLHSKGITWLRRKAEVRALQLTSLSPPRKPLNPA